MRGSVPTTRRTRPPRQCANGYTAEDLLNGDGRGPDGRAIGDIDDLIIGPDGQLRRVIMSVNEVLFGAGGWRLAVKLAHVNVQMTASRHCPCRRTVQCNGPHSHEEKRHV
jgi:hypothetical protein